MLGFPTKFHFENYAVAWTRGGYAYAYASSLIIGFGTAFSVVLLVGLAVYGLYKTDCFFKEFFKSYFVAGLAIPTFAVIVPLFFFFYKINLINTHIGMILIYIGFARGTTICHKFCISDAPSMRAASSSSFDIPSKNADIKVKLNGILIPIYIKIIPIWIV